MKSRFTTVLLVCLMAALAAGCASDAERRQVARGAGAGTLIGGVTGLALAAVTGESEFVAAGLAAGAAAGAAYEYDQVREDRRTKQITDAIEGVNKGETADASGKRHFQDFLGDWSLDIWSLKADGGKVTGSGKAKILMEGKDVLRLEFTDIHATGSDEKFSGASVVAYSPNSGFTMENRYSGSSEVRKLVGEYIPEKNVYNFYPSTNKDGETVTGVIRTNVRVELRVAGDNLVVAETYTFMDGKEVKMQSYRLTKQ